ncbi:Class II abasic (AP) endonuclease [Conoideocrella luteorostrata]|uniref:Class II abasic (AP) endonuclease n=1 Tax=Conoideocrella luteorostrata TaxID=1105319 RepID=A0AAJ0CNZ1_9HYPO|nr:Class II abasic (AP) endonuclease [Conoideocrella luteorostrata]
MPGLRFTTWNGRVWNSTRVSNIADICGSKWHKELVWIPAMAGPKDLPGLVVLFSRRAELWFVPQAMFDILKADIVVMQETKILRKDLQDDMVLVPGWDVFFSLPKYKKGENVLMSAKYQYFRKYHARTPTAPCRYMHASTAETRTANLPTRLHRLFRRRHLQRPSEPRESLLSGVVDDAVLDSEGRCVILEFPAFILLGVYSPASRDVNRDEFRTRFFEALDVRIRNLIAMGKQVILMGDLNVIRSEMESTNVLESLQKENMTLEEWMSMPTRRLIFEGCVSGPRDEGRETPVLWDLCRSFHPKRLGMNTCWDTKRNPRPANNGSRIDYILCSDGLRGWFTAADIQEGLMGSDHCPVFATLSDLVTITNIAANNTNTAANNTNTTTTTRHGGNQAQASLLDLMNPPGMFEHGQHVRELGPRDVLPLSARLIPAFDGRQSIRDMFSKKARARPIRDAPSAEPTTHACHVAEALDPTPGTNTAEHITSANHPVNSQHFESRRRPSESLALSNQLIRSKSGAGPNVAKPSPSSGSAPAPNPPKQKPSLDSNATHLKDTRSGAASTPNSQKTLNAFFKSVSQLPAASSALDSTPTSHPPHQQQDSSDRVFDPIQNKESWSKLLGKRLVPRCEHAEPCISLVTKKPGVDRSTFVLGLSGPRATKKRGLSGAVAPLS